MDIFSILKHILIKFCPIKYKQSVIYWKTMRAFITFIKHCWALICTTNLHRVIFKFRMLTNWTWFFDCHFGFTSSLFCCLAMHIFSDPIFFFLNDHMTLYGFANKLFETEFIFTWGASNFFEKAVKINQTATFRTEIRLKVFTKAGNRVWCLCWHSSDKNNNNNQHHKFNIMKLNFE